jgi:N-acetylneuraminic acid mutarotase
MIEARSHFATVPVGNDTVYVLGGNNAVGIADSVLEYTVSTDKWTMLSNNKMPVPVTDCVAAHKPGTTVIFVFGGTSANGAESVVQEFDTASNSWTSLDETQLQMPRPRSSAALIAADNLVTIAGGTEVGLDGTAAATLSVSFSRI